MCPLCEQEAETADHLALGCVFAREVWHSALARCGLGQLVPSMDATLIEWWPASRAMIPKERRKGFDSLALLIIWMLWRDVIVVSSSGQRSLLESFIVASVMRLSYGNFLVRGGCRMLE